MITRLARSKQIAFRVSLIALMGAWAATVGIASASRSAVPVSPHRIAAAPPKLKGRPASKQAVDALANPGCISCHTGARDPHPGAAQVSCTDCHGGQGEARTKAEAHEKPRHPEAWTSSANPKGSYTLLNNEDPKWIRFVNPGDLRAAGEVCARCHQTLVHHVQLSPMVNSAQVYSTALYNNASVTFKDARFAENYDANGRPRTIRTIPAPTAAETRLNGVLAFLAPLPRFEITQPGTIFRPFERGGGPKSELGNPNREDVPGQPDVSVSNRGFGTQGSIDPVFLGAQKTRLNDPVLSFLGTNDSPGDYRTSGCTSCHVVYANDRDPFNAGPYAKFGNRGLTVNPDPTIPKNESGHPIKHEFTRAIPSSQCITCHVHNGNGFLNTYLGEMWWDEETDGEHLYPKTQRNPTLKDFDMASHLNPEKAAARGLWGDPKFLETVSEMNPTLRQAQFSDYHGHGWMFQKVFSRDRKGNFLDANGKIVPFDDKDLWAKAVHLKDIHLEKGMQCVDCHFTQDAHGNGKVYGDRRAAVEIGCVDCHGTTSARATLKTSGPASAGGRELTALGRATPWGPPQFQVRGGRIIQRSMVDENLQWNLPQVMDSIDPQSPQYNPAARYAKTIQKDGTTWGNGSATEQLAHQDTRMTCYSCHTSWTTNCFGCHLSAQVNTKKPMLHNEGDETQLYASYNPQVLRTDGYMLGIDGTVEGHKVAPVRSSSAVTLSVENGARSMIINQAPTISSAGYNGNAFNTHVPHTVRGKETKQCTDCHVSAAGDNNAWLASVLMLGSNQVNFMGRYIYMGLGGSGVAAVSVTEKDEPQAVFGSHLQKIAYPDNFAAHVKRGGRLTEAQRHGGSARQVQLYGEYLLTAGTRGFEVLDVANVANKDFAQRIVSAPFKSQQLRVDTRDATGLAIGSPSPLDPKRVQQPENEEQPVAPLFGYAFVSDSNEGLIVIDIRTLSDGVPTNNTLTRAATFNPNGELTGARAISLAGNYAYISTPKMLAIVDVSDPLHPKIVQRVGAPSLNQPRAVAVQFRYAFVIDADGVKVLDVTMPERAAAVPGAAVPMRQANGIYLSRTYAYVAGGSEGLVIVDIERPEHPRVETKFTAAGLISDARDVKVGMVNTSLFAYVADGRNGLRVVEVLAPDSVPGNQGYSPTPAPRLIAQFATSGEAVSISEGYRRDRGVDESGNQISVFGRRGARPFSLAEMRKLFLRPDGQVWTVTNTPSAPARSNSPGGVGTLLVRLLMLGGLLCAVAPVVANTRK